MKRQIKYLITSTFSLVLFSINLMYGQSKPSESKIYFERAKFLNTEIYFNNFNAHQDCVGLVMFINISKKKLRIKEITNDSGSIQVKMNSKTIRPNRKCVLTFLLKNPSPGDYKKESFIFFEGINTPVQIQIKGNFK